jgi:hypothetical protein
MVFLARCQKHRNRKELMINVVGGDRMSRKLSIIFVCILCFGGIAQAAAPPLWNGNFSSGLEGWWTYLPNPAAQSVTVVDGAAVIYNADTTIAGDAKLGQGWLDAAPGGNYTVTFDFKATNVAGDGWAGEGVGIEYYDAAGSWVATTWMDLWDTTSYTPDWVPQTLASTAPATAAHVQLVFDVWAGDGGVGTMLVDNATMAPEPATMILLGIGGLVALRRKHA